MSHYAAPKWARFSFWRHMTDGAQCAVRHDAHMATNIFETCLLAAREYALRRLNAVHDLPLIDTLSLWDSNGAIVATSTIGKAECIRPFITPAPIASTITWQVEALSGWCTIIVYWRDMHRKVCSSAMRMIFYQSGFIWDIKEAMVIKVDSNPLLSIVEEVLV